MVEKLRDCSSVIEIRIGEYHLMGKNHLTKTVEKRGTTSLNDMIEWNKEGGDVRIYRIESGCFHSRKRFELGLKIGDLKNLGKLEEYVGNQPFSLPGKKYCIVMDKENIQELLEIIRNS